jgi:hypothetical protein
VNGVVIDEARLRAESAQIERVLDELHELVVPAAWQRVEQVMRLTVALYGTGLAHALDIARRAGANSTFDELCADDELLASLLVLHGLHPMTTAERVERTLATLRSELGLTDPELAVVSLDNGVLELDAPGGLTGAAMSPRAAEGAIRRALEAAAPELAEIAVSGIAAAAAPGLVQLRARKEPP